MSASPRVLLGLLKRGRPKSKLEIDWTVPGRSLRVTTGLIFMALMLIGGLSVGASLWAIHAQQNDALIINLAGRQRMLIQQTVAEAWLGLQNGQDTRYLAQMHATAHQFEENLQTLMDGGQLTYAGTTVSLPAAADSRFRAALEEVQAAWEPLHQAAHAVLENKPGSPAFAPAAAGLEDLSAAALEKMDEAVRIYQARAERKVAWLRWLQLGFLVAGGLILTIGSILILVEVLRPVSALEAAVREMERGNLEHPVEAGVRNELGRLASAFEKMRQRVKAQFEKQTALLDFSQALTGLTDPQAVMEVAARTAQECLEADYVSLMLPDPTGRWLVLLGGVGWEQEMIGRYRLDVNASREGYVLRTGEPVHQPDVQSAEPFPCPPELRERGVVSSLTVPLRRGDDVLGTLCAHSTRPREFSSEETHLLSLIASQTAVALEQAWGHQALGEATARYRGLFDGVPVGLYQTTPAGQILDANLALVEMLRYPDRAALMAVNITELYVDPEDRRRWQALMQDEGVVRDFEMRVRRYDGTVIWVQNSVRAARDDTGRVVYYEGAWEEITERKQVEENLRRRVEELATLFEISLDITAPHELPALLHTIVERAAYLLNTPSGTLFLCDPERQEARCVVSYNTAHDYTGTVLKYGEGATGIVAQTGKPLIIDDYRVWSGRAARYEEEQPFRAVLSAPMIWQDQVIGVVHVIHNVETGCFDQADLELLNLFANHAAIAVVNARLLEAERRQAIHLKTLNTVIAVATAAPDLPALLEATLDRMLETFGLEIGAIWVGQHAAVRRLPTETGPAIGHVAQAVGLDITAPIATEDWRLVPDEDPLSSLAPLMQRFGVRASLTVPVLAEGKRIGGLSLSAREPRAWEDEEIALVESIGRELGAAAERLRLFQEAREQSERLAGLVSIGEALNRPLAVAQVIEAIGQGALALSEADRAAVYVRQPDNSASCPWFHGLSSTYIEQVMARARELPGGRLWASTEPVLCPDVTALPENAVVRQLAEAEGYRAFALWALVYEDRTAAAVGCYYNAPHHWSPVEQELMQTFASQAAIALQNARLFKAEQERRQELAALYALSRELIAADSTEAVLNTVARHAAETVHVTFCRILILEEDGTFICRAAHPVRILERDLGVGKPDAKPAWPYYRDALTQNEPQVLLADDPALDSQERNALYLDLAQSLCLAPLRTGDNLIGVLAFGEARHADREPFDADKQLLITSIVSQAASALYRARLHEQLEESYLETVLALAKAMDARDAYTSDHSARLAVWAEATARELGCCDAEVEIIRWGTLLHDIGKIGVPDDILRKPGPLTDEELEVIRRHPEIGAEIVAPVRKLAEVAPIIHAHQEKWDGTGYPDGLKGEAIPLGARIVAVVDAYGAMTDDRVYRKAMSHEEAVAELRACAGTQFDPQVVEAFLRVIGRAREVG
ncbi:MAG: GAF domain-containing protein [Chloroflexi bacterium]|nr:MAG: GAF domain-containing protein [Chloroflexota bacterium]